MRAWAPDESQCLDCPPGQNEVAVVERWLLVEVRLYPALAEYSKTEDALPQSPYFVPAPPRGLLNKLMYGEAPPRGPTLYPFIHHF